MNRNFRLLLSGQLVSQAGDKFHTIAVAFWILETTGSSGKMGMVLAASLLPSVLVGVFSGAVIDRYSKKMIIVGTDAIRGTVLLMAAWLMAEGSMGFTMILLLQAFLSVNAGFFDPSIPAVIPRIVDQTRLGRANAMHQTAVSLAMISGAALGGMAVTGLGYVWIFALNGVSFLVSAGCESLIHIPGSRTKDSQDSLFYQIRAGYMFLLGSKRLMLVLFMVMAIHFFVGGIEVFMPMIANGIGDNGPKALGLFHAGLGCGTLAAAAMLSRLPITEKAETALFSSVTAMGIIQMLALFLPGTGPASVAGYTACFFLWGCAMIRAAISFKTLLQTAAGEAFSGRVFALASTVGNGSIPAAMIAFGLLGEHITVDILLPVSGLVLSGLGLTAFTIFSGSRHDTEKCRPGI